MIWNAIGNITYLAAQWILTVLVARIAGFADAGILSIAMSVTATFQTIALFGVRNFQASDVNEEYSDSMFFNLRNITCIASLAACVLFSVLGGYNSTQFIAILLFMLFRIAESYTDVLAGMAQKRGRLDIAGKSFAIKGVLVIIFFFSGYYAFDSLNAGLGFMTVSSCLSTLLYDYPAVRKLSKFSVIDKLKPSISLAKKTLPLCVYMFLFVSLTSIPKIVLELLTDEATLGAYSSIFAPATLIQAATGYIYTPFATVFALNLRNNDYKRLEAVILKILLIMLAITGFALVAAHFLGEFLFVIVFGENILEHLYLFNPIIISTMLLSILGFLCMIEIVMRDFIGLIVGCGIGAIAATILSFVLINSFSSQGASYAIIISTTLAICIIAASMTRKIIIAIHNYEISYK